MTEKTTATDLAEPLLEALQRLSAVAEWLEGIDLANITEGTAAAVFSVDRAVRDAARVVTVKARFGLKSEQRHLADAIEPLFIALAGVDTLLEEVVGDDDTVAGWLRSATN